MSTLASERSISDEADSHSVPYSTLNSASLDSSMVVLSRGRKFGSIVANLMVVWEM